MIKTISTIIIFLLLLMPAVSDAAYLIRLKNGGELTTAHYWFEGNQMFFFYESGVAGIEKNQIVGIEKDMVKRIEKYTIGGEEVYEVKTPEKLPAEAQPKGEEIPSPQEPREKIDLKPYQEKMATLKAEVNKTLTRIRKATINKDMEAKDKATADNRRISAEMWKLTDELEKKNNGKLPADWWEGVGREEPATP